MHQLSWRQIQRQNFTSCEKLASYLELSDEQKKAILDKPNFILNLPIRLAKKIEKGTLDDPILRQFVPTEKEQEVVDGFIPDPVDDTHSRKSAKMLHKYNGRVLLVCTSACVVHCRYCFRQNFEYAVKEQGFVEEMAMIQRDASIKEVILSGGDPLSMSDTALKQLLFQIGEISHVKRIRIHSRFPMGIPERIDEPFLEMLDELSQKIYFVIHCNHPREMDHDVMAAMTRLQKRGVIVMNQAVLLKGVNDDPEVLRELCEVCVDVGVIPYYLHQLDRVKGAHHFEVDEEKGIELIQYLNGQLPGYAVPKYVQDIPGKGSKTTIY